VISNLTYIIAGRSELLGVLASCVRTSVEIDERLLCNLSLDITLRLNFLHLLLCSVVGVDVCAVVFVVMQLHDLAGDGWFERAIVVYPTRYLLAVILIEV
jgi:hypothetical protein